MIFNQRCKTESSSLVVTHHFCTPKHIVQLLPSVHESNVNMRRRQDFKLFKRIDGEEWTLEGRENKSFQSGWLKSQLWKVYKQNATLLSTDSKHNSWSLQTLDDNNPSFIRWGEELDRFVFEWFISRLRECGAANSHVWFIHEREWASFWRKCEDCKSKSQVPEGKTSHFLHREIDF